MPVSVKIYSHKSKQHTNVSRLILEYSSSDLENYEVANCLIYSAFEIIFSAYYSLLIWL